MRPLNRQRLLEFADSAIQTFHASWLARLEGLRLNDLPRKNPYLFRAKNILTAAELIHSTLDAFLSSSEEEIFGRFLEGLAVFVAESTCDGRKSSAEGIDLEFDDAGIRYLVSIKSSANWGNSSQVKRLSQNFQTAVRVQRQAAPSRHVQPVLGICYGRQRTTDNGIFRKVVGQSFWYFLSGDPELYVEIIEPIGQDARRHNDAFAENRAAIENRFAHQFASEFCDADYRIDWPKLVRFNSGNLKTAP
jgi:hypothetical protein